MRTTWRSIVVLFLAGGLLAGCASTQEPAEQPIEEPPPQAAPTPTVVEPEPEPQDFNSSGQPIGPSGNVLSTTFYFELDQARLSQRDLRLLELHAEVLQRNSDRRVIVEGHCDERGTREYNLALGERRANAIASFLSSAGISGRQTDTVSYGEERPADAGHDETAWRKNRRAVLIYR